MIVLNLNKFNYILRNHGTSGGLMQVNLWGYDVNTFRSGYLLESEAFTQPLNGGGGGGDGCYRLPLVQEHFAVY